MKKRKSLIVFLISVVLIFALCIDVLAAWTQGYDGVSTYTTGNCAYGSRAGAEYVTNLHNRLRDYGIASAGTVWTNNYAWESDVTSGFADGVNFFAFSGHGLSYDYFGSTDSTESSLHFYTLNSSSNFHTTETTNAANAQWSEVRLGAGSARWVTTYNCNFLANGGSTTREGKIKAMFQGVRLWNGFASIMFLDSREGTLYAYWIGMGKTLKNSFFLAADQYQIQRPVGKTTICRSKGYKTSTSDNTDTFQTSPTRAPIWNSTNNSLFSSWDHSVAGQG